MSDWLRSHRIHTIAVRKDVILHMGLPFRVEENYVVIARFPDRGRAVDYATDLYEKAGGALANVEFLIEPRTPEDA